MENEIFNDMFKVETQHWWFVARRRIIECVITKLNLDNDALIFDAGCGTGDNLNMLSRFGNVIAMERDANAFEKANSRATGKVYRGELPDGVSEEIQNNNDLIVLLDVLEHIDDDGASLITLKKYLKTQGKLIITVPAYQFLWTERDNHHHHKRRYTITNLKKVMEDNGWQINYISYFNTLLFPLALIDRLKQKIFPVEEDSDLKMPPNWLNAIFKKIFSFESMMIGKLVLPFGLSIIAVAEKA